MEFSFDGERRLDGKPVQLNTHKLFDSPFMKSELKSGIIRMMYGGRVRELNFNKSTIKEWQTTKQ